jgi:sugar transferase (PEP-CTERM/EpsH1 system associated)
MAAVSQIDPFPMAKILFLAHRVPFPPNKGDKIRAYHILEHLAAHHDVWLGAIADDPADMAHLPWAKQHFADACFAAPSRLHMAANMALGGLGGLPLSVARFRHPRLARWIASVLDQVRPDIVYVFSSALSHYVAGRVRPGVALIVDFVDADAEKWRSYAAAAAAPARWIYAAEFRSLVRHDGRVLDMADAGILVSETERRLLAGFIPAAAAKLHVITNGVDTDHFAPPGPAAPSQDIVFTGMMDYLPNIDAVIWFAHEIFPLVRQTCPQARFRVVGARPTAAVSALADVPGVEVTGAVPDIRPYLHGAAAVVAPLRIARGIQNKVLEGMAAARPVIVTSQALDGIGARHEQEVLVADDAMTTARATIAVLQGKAQSDLGAAARAYVVAHHRWQGHLATLDALLARMLHGAHARFRLKAGETRLATDKGSRCQTRIKNA